MTNALNNDLRELDYNLEIAAKQENYSEVDAILREMAEISSLIGQLEMNDAVTNQ